MKKTNRYRVPLQVVCEGCDGVGCALCASGWVMMWVKPTSAFVDLDASGTLHQVLVIETGKLKKLAHKKYIKALRGKAKKQKNRGDALLTLANETNIHV